MTFRDFITFLLFPLSIVVYGQDLSVTSIPDQLKKDTDVVYRLDELHFDVVNPGQAIKHVREIKTILNAGGKSASKLIIHYDDLISINSLEVFVYDKSGKKIDTYKKKDFDDWAAYDGVSIYSDSRVLKLDLSRYSYPYTIDLKYELDYRKMMFYPTHYFQSSSVSIEKSIFKVSLPENMKLRYKPINISEPSVESVRGKRIYQWELANQPKIKREPLGPGYEEILPHVVTSPGVFEMSGYEGNFSTWDGIGKFQNDLFNGLEEIPEEKKKMIHNLVKEAGSKEEKIESIYNYLQDNFRYVSVQLGIEGWRPISPADVDNTQFGDCKALTFYTKKMLEEVGVDSYYSLIYAGSGRKVELHEEFPVRRFNHALLCVPVEQDTVWLECTSQTRPAGYLGEFTGDRQALVIQEDGASLVNTKTYSGRENLQINTLNVKLQQNGNAEINLNSHKTGLQYELNNLNFILHKKTKDQKQWLYNNLDIPNFQVNDFTMHYVKERLPRAIIEVNLSVRDLASATGKRLFLLPNIVNKTNYIPPEVPERKSDFILNFSYEDIDSIKFDIPLNLFPEVIPEPVTLNTKFGKYSARLINQEGALTYIRKLKMDRGRFSSEDYQEFRAFREAIVKADQMMIIFRSDT